MKKYLLFLFAALSLAASAQTVDSTGRKIKTGWNFGVLPSVAFDADYGFQGGLLTNIYFYGDGSQYPEYIHSLYAEAAYTTKRRGIFRLNYDSKYLIPNHRLTLDATYLPDAMCDFYGFNGFQSVFNQGWGNWKQLDTAQYLSRAFYKMRRELYRLAADMEGEISGPLHWNGGLGVLGYSVDECDIESLNRGKDPFDPSQPHWAQNALDPDVVGLYEQYVDWGLIRPEEAHGGWHPYLRGGLSFDTRDKRQGPTRGIYADAFLTYNSAFGQLKDYNNLQLNFTWRHYVPLAGQRLTFAYRIGTQNRLLGQVPFYANSYLNTQFIQRVLYEGLGGGNSLRGILANRILADGFAYANLELRARVLEFEAGKQHIFVGLNPFLDLGMVTQAYRQEEIEELLQQNGLGTSELADYFWCDGADDVIHHLHMAAGCGLKVGMNENFVLSVDWATPIGNPLFRAQDNNKTSNLYIKMGYLF